MNNFLVYRYDREGNGVQLLPDSNPRYDAILPYRGLGIAEQILLYNNGWVMKGSFLMTLSCLLPENVLS